MGLMSDVIFTPNILTNLYDFYERRCIFSTEWAYIIQKAQFHTPTWYPCTKIWRVINFPIMTINSLFFHLTLYCDFIRHAFTFTIELIFFSHTRSICCDLLNYVLFCSFWMLRKMMANVFLLQISHANLEVLKRWVLWRFSNFTLKNYISHN